MRFVVGGASGFLGSALVDRLHHGGHHVTRLVRRAPHSADESQWDPAQGRVDVAVIAQADVVVNLSGAPIAHWPWTLTYRQELLDSRVQATSTLARAIAEHGQDMTFLSGSAMAYYGRDRADEVLSETVTPGDGFLSRIVHEWENAAEPARQAGARVCFLRTSNVAHREGGLLKPLLPAFRLGMGATIGNGKQFFPLISRYDWVEAVTYLAEHNHCAGPYNLAAPNTQTNAYFTKALATALHRPAVLRIPQFALTTLAGELGKEISGSLRVEPAALLRDSFVFTHASVESILSAALND